MNQEDNHLRMAVIAGATNAMKYLQQHRHASHDEALRHVINNANEIIGKIDNQL